MFKLFVILFVEKRIYALICVSSFNQINSAWMHNMETMPKMAIIMAVILTAIND